MARIGELIGPNGEVMHPKTSASVVYLEDGRSVEQVLSDDIDYGNVVFQDNSYKFDSDVEDDFAKTVIIKGQTYQNILPEPSTHVLTNNKEMFKVNEGLDPNVEIVDGVSKSAILKGQTLNYLLPYKSFSCNNPQGYDTEESNIVRTVYDNHVHYSLTLHSGRGTTISFNHAPNKQTTIYAGKTYTLYIPNYTHQNVKNKRLLMRDNNHAYNYTPIKQNSEYFVFTAIEDFDFLGLYQYFDFDSSYLEKTVECNVSQHAVIVEGDYFNQPLPLLEQGLNSCKMPVLQTVGKNLFDVEVLNDRNKNVTVNNGTVIIDNYYSNQLGDWRGIFGFLKPNSTYFYSCDFTYDGGSEIKEITGGFFLCKTVGDSVTYFRIPRNKAFTTPSDLALYDRTIIYGATSNDGVVALKNIQFTESSVVTEYEPYKSNILHTPEEVVLRSLPNGVCDTLNLNTGEYVQRIDEVVLDGSESWNQEGQRYWTPLGGHIVGNTGKTDDNVLSNKYVFVPVGVLSETDITIGQCRWGADQNFMVNQDNGSMGVVSWKTYLSQNPLTIQCQLATPIIKTLDLSSSGNWEKIVLDGSEGWSKRGNGDGSTTIGFQTPVNGVTYTLLFAEGIKRSQSSTDGIEGYGFDSNQKNFFIELKRSRLTTVDVNGFKQYLQQNPITLWYQTTTHQDSTQVKEPIFFKDGHIQLSSGADHSLIPTLDYQAKTSNSYVMDLMKTGTTYTMKASGVSGTAAIGNAGAFTLNTNRTFISPPDSLFDNKLLVVKGSATDLMIIEGDVTSKAIPYFKCIKSAFEGESKIEVLSTGKNLWSNSYFRPHETVMISGKECISFDSVSCQDKPLDKPFFVNKDKYYRISGEFVKTRTNGESQYFGIAIQINGAKYGNSNAVLYVLGNGTQPLNQLYRDGVTCKFPESGWVTGLSVVNYGNTNLKDINVVADSLLLEELNTSGNNGDIYVEHKSNSTKIPLLSPLRSLPNGVCDELIIDRMKKKATLIQRVGYVTLGQGDGWGSYDNVGDTMKVGRSVLPHVKSNGGGMSSLIPYAFNSVSQPNEGVYIYRHASSSEARVRLKLKRTGRHDAVGMQNWLRNNNIVTLYELETPVITEIDLENFPLVYKDGHIFVNSEIAPTVGIEYGINQAHRIEGQVETLQRHEKQFTQLERYFADLIYSDYNFALLRFNEGLR